MKPVPVLMGMGTMHRDPWVTHHTITLASHHEPPPLLTIDDDCHSMATTEQHNTTQQGQRETTRAGDGPLRPSPTIGAFFKIMLL